MWWLVLVCIVGHTATGQEFSEEDYEQVVPYACAASVVPHPAIQPQQICPRHKIWPPALNTLKNMGYNVTIVSDELPVFIIHHIFIVIYDSQDHVIASKCVIY